MNQPKTIGQGGGVRAYVVPGLMLKERSWKNVKPALT